MGVGGVGWGWWAEWGTREASFSCSEAERAAPSSGCSANSCFYSFSNGGLGPRVALGLHFLEVAEGRDSQLPCVFFILG